MLNYAARLVCGRRKYDHETPLLRNNLHWLRVPERVKFKCCLLEFKALNGLAPTYIADFCVKVPVSEHRSTLRSAGTYQYNLDIPRRASKFAERSFSVSGPAAWNSLPDYIKLSTSVDIFKSRLRVSLVPSFFPITLLGALVFGNAI